MDPNAKPAAQPEGEQPETLTLTREELSQVVNSAVTAQLKRAMGSVNTTIEQAIAKALSQANAKPEAQGEQQQAQQQQASSDPRLKILEQQLAELKRKNEESETRAQKIEREARQNAVRATLKEQLEAKGIKGAKARAVLADLEASGTVRYLEDGRVEGVVRRVRSKGGKPEELTHDDLSAFVADWAQSDDAKEFLPPPVAAPKVQQTRTVAPTNIAQRPDASFEASIAAAGAALESRGIAPADVFNR